MNGRVIKLTESNQSETTSQFVKDAQWRKENESWLKLSRQLAVSLVGYMQDHKMKRSDLAKALNVSPQYVSRLLSGTENLSFKSIANIEDKLGLNSGELFCSLSTKHQPLADML